MAGRQAAKSRRNSTPIKTGSQPMKCRRRNKKCKWHHPSHWDQYTDEAQHEANEECAALAHREKIARDGFDDENDVDLDGDAASPPGVASEATQEGMSTYDRALSSITEQMRDDS